MALTIGIKGGKLKHRLQTISRQVAQTQEQEEQTARNEETCAAMNANPAEGEKAISAIIQANVRQEVRTQLRKQGNGNAVDHQNQKSTAISGRFNGNKDKDDRPTYFRSKSKSKKRKQSNM